MNLLNSLKSAIFEEETPKETHDVKPVTQPQSAAPSYFPPSSYVPPSIQPHSSGKMKQTLVDELNKALVGSPYLQFQKMNSGMKSKIADASTRCVAVGIALEAQNVAKQQILSEANKAKDFLLNEGGLFLNDVNTNIAGIDTQLKEKTENILSSIDANQQTIKKLSDEITELQKEKSTCEIKASQDKSQLEVSKIEFNASLNEILQEVNADINDITKYLGV